MSDMQEDLHVLSCCVAVVDHQHCCKVLLPLHTCEISFIAVTQIM